MDERGRIESDGTFGGTRIWLAGVEVTTAVHRIEWIADARTGKTDRASVVISFFADVVMELTGLKGNDPAPLFTETRADGEATAHPDQ
jgi:hypothetical protein